MHRHHLAVSSFLSLSWPLLSFWGHFQKSWLSLQSNFIRRNPIDHWDREGHPWGSLPLLLSWAIKYISCSACFVTYIPKKCLISLYWNNIGIIIIMTMMIFHQAIFGAYFLALGALLTVLDVWWVQQHWIHLTGCERKEKFQIYGGKPLFLLFQKMKRISILNQDYRLSTAILARNNSTRHN